MFRAKATILCIDDHWNGLIGRKMLLEQSGYQVLEASGGDEGLKLFRSHPVDAVVLDYQMPGMNGVELQCRLIEDGHSLPVIFMTAFPEDTVGERVLEKGACGYLSKPLDEERLLTCLTKALSDR